MQFDRNGFTVIEGFTFMRDGSGFVRHSGNRADCEAVATATGGELMPPLRNVRGRATWHVRLPIASEQHRDAGELAYIEDCLRLPVHHDGTKRPEWQSLDSVVQWSWHRNPTARDWSGHPQGQQL